MIEAPAVVTLVVTAIGAIVWLIRLEGRVNTSQALHEELKVNHASELKDLKADVRYIRERIDKAITLR